MRTMVELTRVRAEAVSRAFLRLLGYDPDTHDIFDVKGKFPGVRITCNGRPVRYLPERKVRSYLDTESGRAAMHVLLELES